MMSEHLTYRPDSKLWHRDDTPPPPNLLKIQQKDRAGNKVGLPLYLDLEAGKRYAKIRKAKLETQPCVSHTTAAPRPSVAIYRTRGEGIRRNGYGVGHSDY